MFDVTTFPVGSFQCNCSIISCPRTREAVIVDPGDEAPRIAERVKAQGFRVRYLLHTHAHLDHIGGTFGVKQRTGGDVVLHRDDLFLYQAADLQARMMGLNCENPPPVDHYLQDEETFGFGDFVMRAIFTPGHTPGSTSFLIQAGAEQVLFAGDTMFRRSIGRTDLPGGDAHLIARSIRTRLFILDGDTRVIPGHGPGTTIGEEIYENPFVGIR